MDRVELVQGLRYRMNIHLTDFEADELVKYLDADGSGDIDFKEFSSKINFKDLQ